MRRGDRQEKHPLRISYHVNRLTSNLVICRRLSRSANLNTMEANNLSTAAGDLARRDAQLHREILQLAVLIAVAVTGFVVTRAVAADSRRTTLRDAQAWYERGQQQLAAGEIGPAIESLRRASVRNRDDRRYALALAVALGRAGDADAARSALITLRDLVPEDPEVNLALARLDARRGDVTEAVRFYYNALYAPWPSADAEARRQVRFELIELLLDSGQVGRASAELLALVGALPDTAVLHVRAARLFVRAGDSGRALDQFERVLAAAPDNAAALVGAGSAAFSLGNLMEARAYLRRVPDPDPDVARMLEVTTIVLTNDPLAGRIGSAERRRRLAACLDYARQRIGSCLSNSGGPPGELALTQREAEAVHQRINRGSALDQDAVEAGVDLVERLEDQAARLCGPPTAWDEALMLIARRHGTEKR
jgi:Flp pilus assembly protein TadD